MSIHQKQIESAKLPGISEDIPGLDLNHVFILEPSHLSVKVIVSFRKVQIGKGICFGAIGAAQRMVGKMEIFSGAANDTTDAPIVFKFAIRKDVHQISGANTYTFGSYWRRHSLYRKFVRWLYNGLPEIDTQSNEDLFIIVGLEISAQSLPDRWGKSPVSWRSIGRDVRYGITYPIA
jgi:hypothetical protein